MKPIPTGASPSKTSMCIIICNVLYIHIRIYIRVYVYYVCWDFSEPVNWHLCSCTVYIHMYMYSTFVHECSTFVCTVLLNLSRSVYVHICIYICIYMYVCTYILVYICKDLYCTSSTWCSEPYVH